MESDQELFEKYKCGESSAFETLYRRYRKPILAYVCKITGNTETGEDIYSDIWIALISHAGRYQGENFRALLYRIARNRAINIMKRGANESKVVNQLQGQSAISSFGETWSYEEQVELMDKIASQLSEISRKTYELRRSGMSYDDISKETNTPVGTVKSRMFNIIKKLRKQVQGHDV